MKFFITKLIFKNRAPFDYLDIDLKENEIGVLTASNGRGKTTILSHIIDAFHEIAKTSYHNHFEGKENKYYRVSKSVDNLNTSEPSIFYMRANLNGENVDYINTRGHISEDEYNNIALENKIPYDTLRSSFESNNTIKYSSLINDEKKASQIFSNNLITYFPSYRFEKPGYIGDSYETKLSFRTENIYTGHMINPLEVISGLEPFSNWLMDIVLDMQYQQSNVHFLKANIDKIITLVLSGKQKHDLRFGIGPRGFGQTRIQILDTTTNETIYPTIFSLSAGEAAALCMFGELIRQSDNLDNNTRLANSSGVVLIDEVDKHLHIKLQKEVLPFLFSIFPNVQLAAAETECNT